MKTKIFLSVLLGIMALAMSSCSRTEYRPTDGNCTFVIKKTDGKRQWGMVASEDGREYVSCQYDSIFSAYGFPYKVNKLFIAVKNAKLYAIDYRGRPLLKNYAFDTFTSNTQKSCHNKGTLTGGSLFHEAQAGKNIMFFCLSRGIEWIEFGPAEAVIWGEITILVKRNGKWGVINQKTREEIFPCTYDSIINVGEAYFWLKKDGKWFAFWQNGKIAQKSNSLLNKYLKMPSMNEDQYQKEEKSALFRKISLQEASYISVNSYNASYISW